MRTMIPVLSLSVLALGACKEHLPGSPTPVATLAADAATVAPQQEKSPVAVHKPKSFAKAKPLTVPDTEPSTPSKTTPSVADAEAIDDDIVGFAKQHYELARAAHKAGKYQEVIKELKKSFLLNRHPLLLVNVARSYCKLGDRDNQIYYYKKYLMEAPDNAPDRAAIAASVKALESNATDIGDTSFVEVAFPTSAKPSF